MGKDLTLINHDAELTLSDGTPVRLALPGPAPRRGRPWLLLSFLAALTGYGVWFAQQPWLFLDGPALVSQSTPSDMEPVLCQRMIEQWNGNGASFSPWLPTLDLDQHKPRCLNQPLKLENWVARGLSFIGVAQPTLRLEAIERSDGWALRAKQDGPAIDQAWPTGDALSLVEPLNEIALSALDPVLAAQARLRQNDLPGALAQLDGEFSASANLTRARTLRLQDDLDTAWKLYEQHTTGRLGGLARAGLAEIAAIKGDIETATTLLQDPAIPKPLVPEVALMIGDLALAQDMLSFVKPSQRASLQARIESARGSAMGVINALGELSSEQRSYDDQRLLVLALIERAQYADALSAITQLSKEDAAYFSALVTFEQGNVSLARAELDRLGEAAEPLRTLNFLDDRRTDRALDSADPTLRQIAQAQRAIDQSDWQAAQVIHSQLAKTQPHWANYLAARINIAAGHSDAAQQAIDALPRDWRREKRRLNAALAPTQNWGLTAGEQRLFGLAEPAILAVLEDKPSFAAQRAQAYLNQRNDSRMRPLLARALTESGQIDSALEVFLAINEQLDVNAREQAIELAVQAGRPQAVIELAHTYSPQLSTGARNQLLEAWLSQENYEEAENLIRQVAVDSPRSAQLFLRWGQILEASQDWTGAASKYGRAARLDETQGDSLVRWAMIEQAQGRDASPRMNAAIARQLSPQSWQLAADYFESKSDVDSAIVALGKALETQDDDAARLRLARLQASQGLNKSAIENFTRVMSPDVTDPAIWRAWGDALAALGETEAALDKYKRAVRLARN